MGVVAGVRDATRIRSAWIISGRPTAAMIRLDLFSTFTALAPYAVVAVAAALAGFVLQNNLHPRPEGGVVVVRHPVAVSPYGRPLLVSGYLAAPLGAAGAGGRAQCTPDF